MNKNSPGRPKGKTKDNRLNVMIPTNIKNEFQTIAKKMVLIYQLKLVS